MHTENPAVTAIPKIGIVSVTLLGRSLSRTIESYPNIDKIKDAYQLPVNEGEAFVFDYSILVTWGVSEKNKVELLDVLSIHTQDPLSAFQTDIYQYEIDPNKSYTIFRDTITITQDSNLSRLAISHALAQSLKLAFFEQKAEKVIEKNLYLPKKLAKDGKITLRSKKVAQLRGVLFDTSCDITLNFNLLDKPSFFWDFPKYENYYTTASQYLEIMPRVDLLNQKLLMIRDFLEMLAEEQHQKQSHMLECVIVLLIAMEVVLFFYNMH